VHPDPIRDLAQHIQHRGLAVARSEEGKQVDRPWTVQSMSSSISGSTSLNWRSLMAAMQCAR
jgi:hypothetical protein